MADTPVRWHERVLVTRRSATGGPPLTGTAVGRWINSSNEPVVTVVLDAPDSDGRAILDCLETDLLVLPDGDCSRSKGGGPRTGGV